MNRYGAGEPPAPSLPSIHHLHPFLPSPRNSPQLSNPYPTTWAPAQASAPQPPPSAAQRAHTAGSHARGQPTRLNQSFPDSFGAGPVAAGHEVRPAYPRVYHDHDEHSELSEHEHHHSDHEHHSEHDHDHDEHEHDLEHDHDSGSDDDSKHSSGRHHNNNGARAGSAGEPAKKKRKRQALSCTECKRRKIKCDRNHPCGPCLRRGEQEKCKWHVIESTNDRFVTRAEHEDLKRNVQRLHAIVVNINTGLPNLDSQVSSSTAMPPSASVSSSSTSPCVSRYPPGISSDIIKTEQDHHEREMNLIEPYLEHHRIPASYPSSRIHTPRPQLQPPAHPHGVATASATRINTPLNFYPSSSNPPAPHHLHDTPSSNVAGHLKRAREASAEPLGPAVSSHPHSAAAAYPYTSTSSNSGLSRSAVPVQHISSGASVSLVSSPFLHRTLLSARPLGELLSSQSPSSQPDTTALIKVLNVSLATVHLSTPATAGSIPLLRETASPHLVSFYLSHIHPLAPLLDPSQFHRRFSTFYDGTIEARVERFFEQQRDDCPIAFIALLCMVCCLALARVGPVEAKRLGMLLVADEGDDLVNAWKAATAGFWSVSSEALELADYTTSTHIEVLQTLILSTQCDIAVFDVETVAHPLEPHAMTIALATRLAYKMGLSNLGSEPSNDNHTNTYSSQSPTAPPLGDRSLVAREVARRVWWNVVMLDWHLSATSGLLAGMGGDLALGRPGVCRYSIQPSHFDTVLPANVDWEGVVVGKAWIERPPGSLTSTSLLLFQIELANRIRALADRQNDARFAGYDELLEHENAMKDALASGPKCLVHCHPELERTSPHIKHARIVNMLAIYGHEICLHRGFLLKGYSGPSFQRSVAVCVAAARGTLLLVEEAKDIGLQSCRSWALCMQSYTAAVVLLIDQFYANSSVREIKEERRKQVFDTVAALQNISDACELAKRAIHVLDFIQADVDARRGSVDLSPTSGHPPPHRRQLNQEGTMDVMSTSLAPGAGGAGSITAWLTKHLPLALSATIDHPTHPRTPQAEQFWTRVFQLDFPLSNTRSNEVAIPWSSTAGQHIHRESHTSTPYPRSQQQSKWDWNIVHSGENHIIIPPNRITHDRPAARTDVAMRSVSPTSSPTTSAHHRAPHDRTSRMPASAGWNNLR